MRRLIPLILAVTTSSAGAIDRLSLDDYPGKWRDDAPLEIILVLARHKVRGCGDFQYLASRSKSTRFLVRYNGADGAHFYKVSTAEQSIKPLTK